MYFTKPWAYAYGTTSTPIYVYTNKLALSETLAFNRITILVSWTSRSAAYSHGREGAVGSSRRVGWGNNWLPCYQRLPLQIFSQLSLSFAVLTCANALLEQVDDETYRNDDNHARAGPKLYRYPGRSVL